MKQLITTFLIAILAGSVFALSNIDTTITESDITLHTSTGDIYGTLTMPPTNDRVPVALIIAGSGPTDRDGNNPMMQNNSLKMLAMGLAENGIASLRYDKRGIAASKDAAKEEIDLRFENYVEDAKAWLDLLKQDKRFSEFVIVGHSEGSLIGMLAAGSADKYVSLAGAGQSADIILKTQISAQPQQVQDMTFPIIDTLKAGHTVDSVSIMLYSLFRPSVQPYLISWFHYDPQEAISKLKIPVLIVQGTADLQISEDDAQRLASANPHAQLVIIQHMNHLFKIVGDDLQENLATYNNPSIPIAEEVVTSVVDFILGRN